MRQECQLPSVSTGNGVKAMVSRGVRVIRISYKSFWKEEKGERDGHNLSQGRYLVNTNLIILSLKIIY